MQIQSGSTYKASFSIPQLTALYFKVTATDNQGGITSSTPTMVTLYTGIDATAAEKIEIYPNPAHQQFFVSSNSNSPINIGVYDLTGKKIIERKNQRSNQSIDISALTNGIYLIRISSENGMVTKKLTVSK